MAKIDDSITNKKPLFCIGYPLPDNLDLIGEFAKPVYFSEAKFQGIDFSHTKFSGSASFESTIFSGESDFQLAEFSGRANFRYAKFSEIADFSLAKSLE